MDWWTWGHAGTTNVAVVHLDGSIVDFEQDQEGIVADRVVQQLERLKDMSWIEAVVLKVGYAYSGPLSPPMNCDYDQTLRRVKKVIAYMENVAASGGYYIS